MYWIKALHIIFVTSWFAGLFYLPRIFVNLAMAGDGAERDRLLLMAHKLYRFMTPLGVLALVFGLWAWRDFYGFQFPGGWMHAKLLLVLFLLGYHAICGRLLADFMQGRNTHNHVWYRWFNEAPVIILFMVVVLVVVKPF
jgi:putative membrane protein